MVTRFSTRGIFDVVARLLQVVCPTLPNAKRSPSASELPSLGWLVASNVGCLRTLCLSRLWHNIHHRCVVNSLRGVLPSEVRPSVQSRLSTMWMLPSCVCWSSLPSSLETSDHSQPVDIHVRYLSPPIASLNRCCFTAAYESRKQTVTLSMIEYWLNAQKAD